MKTIKYIWIGLVGMFSTITAFAQNNNVGIGTTTPDETAALEIKSTNQGFLPPRLNSSEILSIPSPAEGLMVYNTSQKMIYFFNGSNWMDMNNNPLIPNVQQRLDILGETPIQIFNSGIPLDSLYSKKYQGGLIAYLNTSTGTGLIAATSDQSNNQLTWWNGSNTNTGASGTTIGAGESNTNAIVTSQGAGNYAASVCDTYSVTLGAVTYSDWYLPSKDELNLLWQNLADYDGNGENLGLSDPNNLGGFQDSFYWSSSETNNSESEKQDFYNGSQFFDLKNTFGYVRAVRAF